MSVETERADFEAAISAIGLNPVQGEDGCYHYPEVAYAWYAWQASIAADRDTQAEGSAGHG